jgi:4-amino-4-deoxy-L-arabinose transferase-like glycosyltransferase
VVHGPTAPDLAAAPSPREARELALLIAGVLGALGWLSDKAFTIDDPMYVWLAERILSHPLDPYGFSVNWSASQLPMHVMNQNPPLTSYFIAAVAAFTGFDETSLHLAFLVPAAIATAATWLLARRFCARPLEAGAISLLTPACLVSASNVMCEPWLLAFWCTSLACWVTGFDRGRLRWHVAAAACAALAFLTKFSGVALVPLLFAYGWLRVRRPGAWCLTLLLPVAAVLAYELATRAAYGTGHLSATLAFARWFSASDQGVRAAQLATGLVFAGGCLIPVIVYAPLLGSRRALVAAGLALAAGVAAWPLLAGTSALPAALAADAPRHLVAQWLLFGLGGAALVALAVSDLRARRDADAALLALWLIGMLVFASFFNWVGNARSLLPAAPAAGILIVRRLTARPPTGSLARAWRSIALALAALVALRVADADRGHANDVRRTASLLAVEAAGDGHETFFLGNWGLQYYLELAGARPVDADHFPGAGDRLIVSTNNTDVREPPRALVRRVVEIEGREPGLLRTMSRGVAGFYASAYGPLPWAVAAGPPDRYRVFELAAPVRFPPSW